MDVMFNLSVVVIIVAEGIIYLC
jgi:hypothetical protein